MSICFTWSSSFRKIPCTGHPTMVEYVAHSSSFICDALVICCPFSASQYRSSGLPSVDFIILLSADQSKCVTKLVCFSSADLCFQVAVSKISIAPPRPPLPSECAPVANQAPSGENRMSSIPPFVPLDELSFGNFLRCISVFRTSFSCPGEYLEILTLPSNCAAAMVVPSGDHAHARQPLSRAFASDEAMHFFSLILNTWSMQSSPVDAYVLGSVGLTVSPHSSPEY